MKRRKQVREGVRIAAYGLAALGSAVALAQVLRRRTSDSSTADPKNTGGTDRDWYLLPVGTADTTLQSVEAAVQPQLDALAAQVWRMNHPLDGTAPGVTASPTSPPPVGS